jgi:hypothetical protein
MSNDQGTNVPATSRASEVDAPVTPMTEQALREKSQGTAQSPHVSEVDAPVTPMTDQELSEQADESSRSGGSKGERKPS